MPFANTHKRVGDSLIRLLIIGRPITRLYSRLFLAVGNCSNLIFSRSFELSAIELYSGKLGIIGVEVSPMEQRVKNMLKNDLFLASNAQISLCEDSNKVTALFK